MKHPKIFLPEPCIFLIENKKLQTADKFHPYNLRIKFNDSYSIGQSFLFETRYKLNLYHFCNNKSNFSSGKNFFNKTIKNLYDFIDVKNLLPGQYALEIEIKIETKICGIACPYLDETVKANSLNEIKCDTCKKLVAFFYTTKNETNYKCLKIQIKNETWSSDNIDSFILKEALTKTTDKSFVVDEHFQIENSSIKLESADFCADNVLYVVKEPISFIAFAKFAFSCVAALILIIFLVLIFIKICNFGKFQLIVIS